MTGPGPGHVRAPSRDRGPVPARSRGGRRAAAVTATAAVVLVLVTGCAVPGAGTSTAAPPWAAPTDLTARAQAAGLQNVWGERLAEHVHTHLTILDGDRSVTVPANVGHSDAQDFAAQLHTHDTSGILHVESPTRETFRLGQFFDEWGVRLDAWRVGGLHGDLTVWVDGRRWFGNPRDIALEDRRQIVLAVTTAGEVPRLPAPFDWPPQYR